MTNIKYFGFAKEGASVPVLGLTLSHSDEEDIKIEVSKVHPANLGVGAVEPVRPQGRRETEDQVAAWVLALQERFPRVHLPHSLQHQLPRKTHLRSHQPSQGASVEARRLRNIAQRTNGGSQSTLKLHTQETLQ